MLAETGTAALECAMSTTGRSFIECVEGKERPRSSGTANPIGIPRERFSQELGRRPPAPELRFRESAVAAIR